MTAEHRLGTAFESLLAYGEHDGENELTRGRRRVIVGAIWLSLPFIAVSGLLDLGERAYLVAAATGVQVLVHAGALVVLRVRPTVLTAVLAAMFAYDIVGELIATYMYGGLTPSAATISWALIAVLGALIVFSIRSASYWFLGFAVAVVVAASMPSWVEPTYTLRDVGSDLAVNLIGSTFLAFLVMAYFVKQRDRLQDQSDTLLHNILPNMIADRLKSGETSIADHIGAVSVLFADIVDFTPLTQKLHATQLVRLLSSVFGTIDDIVEASGLEKIKTVGDEYMVAAGVPEPDAHHADRIADLALNIREALTTTYFLGYRLEMRIGIASGPVVAGVIGDARLAYDLWGTTVNMASRLESTGAPNHIHVSAETHRLLGDRFLFEPRPPVDAKGLGMLETYTLLGRNPRREGKPNG